MKISEILLNKGRDRKKRGPRPKWDKHVGLHNRMKDILNAEKKPVISEGGHAVSGTGPIAREELLPTLRAIEKSLGINLSDVTLGSAGRNKDGSIGKKQFSGDIDASVDITPEQKAEFIAKLKQNPLIKEIHDGNTISTKVKIVDYDPNRTDRDGNLPKKPRTGYVQLDFMPGDVDVNRSFYHSPSEDDSKYGGVYRSVFLATLAAVYGQKNSAEKTEHGAPLESERFKMSPSVGLVRVKRTPVPKAKGDGYTKRFNDEVIDGPWKTQDEIAKQLNLGTADDLDSFESLYNAVKSNWPKEEAIKAFTDYANNRQIKELGVPEEIKGYIK